MKVANKEMSVRKLWTSNELLDAVSARKAVSIGKLRGEALRAALSEMRDPELMAFLSNVDVSRVAKIVAVAVALMDMSDYDWPSHCDVTSVGALCEALYSCTSIHETVLLEDSCAHLAHRRPDLLSSIGACAPDHYPMVA